MADAVEKAEQYRRLFGMSEGEPAKSKKELKLRAGSKEQKLPVIDKKIVGEKRKGPISFNCGKQGHKQDECRADKESSSRPCRAQGLGQWMAGTRENR